MINSVNYRHEMENAHVCESHRDGSRTECSEENHREKEAEEDKKQVGGCPVGSELAMREEEKCRE